MAKIHLEIHNTKSSALKDIKEVIKRSVSVIDIDDDIKKKIITYTDGLPDGDTVCHLDFHPDNIIKDGNSFTVIDWANAVKGCKAADVYNTIFTISSGTVPPGTPKEIENLINSLRIDITAQYLKYYLEQSDFTREEVDSWELPILAYRCSHGIPEEQAFLIKRINELVSNL